MHYMVMYYALFLGVMFKQEPYAQVYWNTSGIYILYNLRKLSPNYS